MKPLISDKSVSRDRINLMEKEKIVNSESETDIFDKLISNIVKNRGIAVFDISVQNHRSILASRDTKKIVSFVSKKSPSKKKKR